MRGVFNITLAKTSPVRDVYFSIKQRFFFNVSILFLMLKPVLNPTVHVKSPFLMIKIPIFDG